MATILAGVPAHNMALYHAIRFAVGDPAALIEHDGRRTLIIRDIEADRARQHARADVVHCYEDFTPDGGLSSDRETATAQAAAECLRRMGVRSVRCDRTFTLSYAEALRAAGIAIEYDPELGVSTRRAKDQQEVAWLRESQRVTERAMETACRMIANAKANADGTLVVDGEALTSERVMTEIDLVCLRHGHTTPGSIVAGGPRGADCHERGHGPLRTGEPVIVDIFPQSKRTLYNGDCTRVVVHGDVPDPVRDMHSAVVEAKRAAIAATREGTTGDAVHAATAQTLRRLGYHMGLPPKDAPPDWTGMVHGTGHGIGLDVHEPPLLVEGGPELVVGDALTIEPGLYCAAVGGIRIEDMVIVTADGCENLNTLHEGLDWRG